MARIYLAGPIFDEASLRWRTFVAALLERYGHDVFLPEDGEGDDSRDKNGICRNNFLSMVGSNIVVAILDGPGVDDGTAVEIGYAYAKGIPVVGLRTPRFERRLVNLNHMVCGVCDKIVEYEDGSIAKLPEVVEAVYAKRCTS